MSPSDRRALGKARGREKAPAGPPAAGLYLGTSRERQCMMIPCGAASGLGETDEARVATAAPEEMQKGAGVCARCLQACSPLASNGSLG